MSDSPANLQLDLFGEAPSPATESAPAPPPPPAEELAPEEKAARMEEVRAPALGCCRCPLSQTRTNVVFGEGNPAAPLVLVGEGPGENEDATGRPFVGRAGKLLDEALRENGMTREHVYICNIIKCRAADLQEGRWVNRSPVAEEIAACSVWLESQLRIIRPLVILCLGSPAASTLIRKGFRITQERGHWFRTSPYAVWIGATLHPAWVLRNHGPAFETARRQLVEDIGAARRQVIEAKRAGDRDPPAAGAPPGPPSAPPSLF